MAASPAQGPTALPPPSHQPPERPATHRVLGWPDLIAVVISALVALAVIGLVGSSSAQGDALAANATVAAVGSSFLACVDLAIAPMGPAVAAAAAVFSGVGNMTLSEFVWLQAGTLAGPLEGAAAGARGYMEQIGDAGTCAAWAARMSAEYGHAVVPGSSCAGSSGDLVMSYCAAGSAGGVTGACDPPLFECVNPAAPQAANDALARGAPLAARIPAAGQYRIFAPVRAGRRALIFATVDVGALLDAAAAAASLGNVAVAITDAGGGEGDATLVYTYGTSAGIVALVAPVVALRSVFGRNLRVTITPSAGFVSTYTAARNRTTILLMTLVPVRACLTNSWPCCRLNI
jgi:hypothetical protein